MSVDPPRPRGAYGLTPADRARMIAGTEALMRFGPRIMAELLIETADGEVEALLRRLDGYARIAPLAEALDGGDWTLPLRQMRRPRGRAA